MNKVINMLTYDGKIYRWSGSLPDLKSFVEKTLNLKGSWNSPGGCAVELRFLEGGLSSVTKVL